jgi:hypothetical protein
METPQAIPQQTAAQPVPSQTASGDRELPWLIERVAIVRTKPLPQVEVVHWGVVGLTLLTAASLLVGAFGGASRPKELLPVIITTQMR